MTKSRKDKDMLDNRGMDPNLTGLQFIEGTPVYDINGDKVGEVSEHGVQAGRLVIHKGLFFPKDIYVPLSAMRGADANGVYLNLSKEDINNRDWDNPGAATTDATTASDIAPANTGRWADTGTSTGPAMANDTSSGFVGGGVPPTPTREGDVAVPVREEELLATKERGEAGRMHVHRDVVEEQQTVSAPVSHEEVRVERNPVSGAAPVGDDAFTERDIDVPVMGEQLNVEKQARTAEEVHLHKDRVTEQQQASDTVRRERVNITGDDNLVEDQGATGDTRLNRGLTNDTAADDTGTLRP